MDAEVEDFLDRHADAIATHLLYLRVQEALRKRPKKESVFFPVIDSMDLLGTPKADYPGLGAKIKMLQAIAIKSNVAIITSVQAA
jgi:hypothetical protein